MNGVTTASTGVVFDHGMPLAVILVAAVAAVAVVVMTRGVRRRGDKPGPAVAALRLAFLAVLFWTLLQPAGRVAVEDANKPVFLVAVDNSASMHPSPGNPAGAARRAATRRILESSELGALARRLNVRVVTLGDPAGPPLRLSDAADPGPPGEESPLADGLASALARKQDTPVVGCLLLSDGLETRRTDAGWVAGPWPCPILTLKPEERAADFRPGTSILSLDTPRRALRGAETRLVAVVSGFAAGPVAVRLWRGDTLRDTVPVTLPEGGGRREVVFRLPHPTAGAETWTVETEALPGEGDTRDNRLSAGVEVTEGGGRLTYVEGAPRWESKHLVRELREMPNVRALALVRGPDGRFMAAGDAAPADDPLSAAALRDTRVVILGDLDAAALGPVRAAALAAYVERGGGLILLGGPAAWGESGFRSTPLAPILPVRLGGGLSSKSGDFVVRWTAEGLAHPAFAGEAGAMARPPSLLTLFDGASLVPAATALAVAETPGGLAPVIAARRYGKGAVVTVLTDSLWRWKLHPDDHRSYSRFWRRIVEWMLPESARVAPWSLRLDADTDAPFVRRPVVISTALEFPEGRVAPVTRVTLRVTSPDGSTESRPVPGEPSGTGWSGRAEFTPTTVGEYRLAAEMEVAGKSLASGVVPIRARALTTETESRRADVALLRALSEASGGTHADEPGLLAALDAVKAGASPRTRIEYTGLWQRAIVLIPLLLLLVAEWLLRRRRGLP